MLSEVQAETYSYLSYEAIDLTEVEMFKHPLLNIPSQRIFFLIIGIALIFGFAPNGLGPEPAEAGIVCYSYISGGFVEYGYFADCNQPGLCTNGWNSCEYFCFGMQYILVCEDNPSYPGNDCNNDPIARDYQGCDQKEGEACLLDELEWPCCPYQSSSDPPDTYYDCKIDCEYCY